MAQEKNLGPRILGPRLSGELGFGFYISMERIGRVGQAAGFFRGDKAWRGVNDRWNPIDHGGTG